MKQVTYLAHHGVLGMKWGVRNAETLARYGRNKVKRPKNTKHLNGYSGKMYFISENPSLSKLEPRVPKNFFTDHGYEDSETKRVSFAPSIDKCLAGLSQNVEGKTFTVYSPDDVSSYSIFKPNEKAVPDSKITDELWICEPVTIKKVGSITVTGNRGEEGKRFEYGNTSAELYDDWVYKQH